MSNEHAFHCPVCRAKQTLAESRRRCKADLRLVMQAHRRLEHLLFQRQQASASGDHKRAQLVSAELRWLALNR